MAAASAEHQVADQRDVVVPGDWLAAAHAMGARLDDTPVARPTVNAHVEKAADEQAEEQCDEGFDHRVTRISVGQAGRGTLWVRRVGNPPWSAGWRGTLRVARSLPSCTTIEHFPAVMIPSMTRVRPGRPRECPPPYGPR